MHYHQQLKNFQQRIWQFYQENKRSFAWRHTDNPYHIVVSEIMLQQTQTYRVEPKYEQFIAMFPDFQSLAHASLHDVLAAWQGLGYNRRGKFLHELARKVMSDFGGQLPHEPSLLETLPGIGKATARSVAAFAFNKPTVFIETNIRTVFIHSFFNNRTDVHDKELMPLIAAAVSIENPREWYYALMDYGVHLKKMCVNPSRKSIHHTTQSRFEGSDRQIRGLILKLLTEKKYLSVSDIHSMVNKDTARVENIITQLCTEGFLDRANEMLSIAAP